MKPKKKPRVRKLRVHSVTKKEFVRETKDLNFSAKMLCGEKNAWGMSWSPRKVTCLRCKAYLESKERG